MFPCEYREIFRTLILKSNERLLLRTHGTIIPLLSLLNKYVKKRLRRRCFPVNFMKFLSNTLFIEHFRWLLLSKRNQKYYYVNLKYICLSILTEHLIMLKFISVQSTALNEAGLRIVVVPEYATLYSTWATVRSRIRKRS